MADPLSLGASGTSFIGLGIQVCQELISYCNDWTSFNGEIGNTSEKLNGLRATLEILKDVLPRVETLDASAAPVVQNATRQILSCKGGLDNLQAALTKVRPASTSSGVRMSLQNFKQHSLYPFRKEMLQGLRNTVADMQANLDSAVQVLDL